METEDAFILAAAVGIVLGVVSINMDTSLSAQDAKAVELTEGNSALQREFDVGADLLRQMKQTGSHQTAATNFGLPTAVGGNDASYGRREAMVEGESFERYGYHARHKAGSIYAQSIAATAPRASLPIATAGGPSRDISEIPGWRSETKSAFRGARLGIDAGDLAAITDSNGGMIGVRTGQFYAPAGPGGYVSSRDGTYYTRSGPTGVINTRTGTYSTVLP